MSKARTLALLAAGAAALALALPASAHGYHRGPRVSLSIGFGAPVYYHGWYHRPRVYWPYYAPVVVAAPPVVVAQPPVTYVEQQPAPQAPAAVAQHPAGYWYYCAEQGGYYPYVQQCPGGWQRVSPVPAN